MKRVFSAANLPEAHLLADLLARHGIRVRILNANASSIAGELPIDASLPQVWVDDPADVDRARKLIEGFFQPAAPRPNVKCAACGEDNPGSFELCWSCGRELKA